VLDLSKEVVIDMLVIIITCDYVEQASQLSPQFRLTGPRHSSGRQRRAPRYGAVPPQRSRRARSDDAGGGGAGTRQLMRCAVCCVV
jgi:hypothetical protein